MIGVLGGTFDPIHYGHLRPALDTLQALGLDQVRFVPLNQAVHRAQPLASPEQRLAMVRAAIAGEPRFVADGRELARPGGSYSYDTLVSLRAELGSGVPICLLTGADAFREFLTWHRPRHILGLAHLVVMARPGAAEVSDPELLGLLSERRGRGPADLEAGPAGRIFVQPVTQLDISATRIRALVRDGLSPRFLLPDVALELIDEQNLYRV
jgi:nicotinate-nucleotide adenylyltransferase